MHLTNKTMANETPNYQYTIISDDPKDGEDLQINIPLHNDTITLVYGWGL